MMSTCCSKHVEAWNKHIEKECIKLVINQNYFEMHSQQNILKNLKTLWQNKSLYNKYLESKNKFVETVEWAQ